MNVLAPSARELDTPYLNLGISKVSKPELNPFLAKNFYLIFCGKSNLTC